MNAKRRLGNRTLALWLAALLCLAASAEALAWLRFIDDAIKAGQQGAKSSAALGRRIPISASSRIAGGFSLREVAEIVFETAQTNTGGTRVYAGLGNEPGKIFLALDSGEDLVLPEADLVNFLAKLERTSEKPTELFLESDLAVEENLVGLLDSVSAHVYLARANEGSSRVEILATGQGKRVVFRATPSLVVPVGEARRLEAVLEHPLEARYMNVLHFFEEKGSSAVLDQIRLATSATGVRLDGLLPGLLEEQFAKLEGQVAVIVGHIEPSVGLTLRTAGDEALASIPLKRLEDLSTQYDVPIITLGCSAIDSGAVAGTTASLDATSLSKQLQAGLSSADVGGFLSGLGSEQRPIFAQASRVHELGILARTQREYAVRGASAGGGLSLTSALVMGRGKSWAPRQWVFIPLWLEVSLLALVPIVFLVGSIRLGIGCWRRKQALGCLSVLASYSMLFVIYAVFLVIWEDRGLWIALIRAVLAICLWECCRAHWTGRFEASRVRSSVLALLFAGFAVALIYFRTEAATRGVFVALALCLLWATWRWHYEELQRQPGFWGRIRHHLKLPLAFILSLLFVAKDLVQGVLGQSRVYEFLGSVVGTYRRQLYGVQAGGLM